LPVDWTRTRELALEFEKLCVEILGSAGFDIDRHERHRAWRYDFVAQTKRGSQISERRLIDVKWIPAPTATLWVAKNLGPIYLADPLISLPGC
jgi:hypothetical protein